MKRALLTSLIALNILYYAGEQFGMKLNQVASSVYSWSLPGPLDRMCKLYAKKLVKDPDSLIQNPEGDYFGDLFNARAIKSTSR